ncbi:MAG: TIR domain-containing protein [Chitinispirillia bacterium]|nr:TIR domain-containing protein [Chitinispirillia bacterium]
MSYKNKIFVSFDGDTDIHYYRLMQAWKQNDDMSFNFYDAHDLNYARDTSMEQSIKNQLMERLRSTKIFVLLVGERTRYLYKFVRWEIEQALARNLPIVAVNLNGKRAIDTDRCPPILSDKLVVHISFNAKIMQYALENWLNSHESYTNQGKTGPYYFNDNVYRGLGL